ncbi:hypothetical protein SAMN04489712_104232 [Thermomonospora echinospora]|uniref:Sugar phosphate isomerase/epimerase n=1 Tax=Thermomonospora echinospora TaxID=1992 RepID=A0A1H5YXX1_9ACTN|nr:EboA domain-containing protein [Thermomonospora echinospora]SEG28660.1 hypothetical protein SAMN04489712_104232 [Thermomonospora echinospora]
MTSTTDPVRTLEAALDGTLDERGRRWLEQAIGRVAERGQAVLEVFPAAGRSCGRGPLPGMPGWTVDQAARARLLLALPQEGAPLGELLFDVYRYGDAAERIAVLKALAVLDGADPAEGGADLAEGGRAPGGRLGGHGLPIVRDALRTNDTRLIEAAVGPYAAGHLADDEFRQAVLKCVFVGVPLSAVAGLDRRADRELARMLADYARERTVAGRDVPQDVWPVVERHPEVMQDRGRQDVHRPERIG